MNKRLPYEEELSRQLNDLPLPDENISWNDMKRRLDEDRDDGGIVPPVRRGCLGYSLVLILLALIIWLIVRPDEWLWNKKEKNIASSEKIPGKTNNENTVDHKTKELQKNSRESVPSVIPGKNIDSAADTTGKHMTRDLLKTNNKEDAQQKKLRPEDVAVNEYRKNSNRTNKPSEEKITDNYIRKNKHIKKTPKKIAGGLKSEISPGNAENIDSLKTKEKNSITDKVSTATTEPMNNDSVTKKGTDSDAIKKKIKDAAVTGKNAKQDSALNKMIYFAAGVALQQQLPVSGQKLVPYNSLGRKGTLGDYIPSVYLRMYKDQKWFLQSEFRYGAPQYTKEILYVQKKLVDTFSRTTFDTSNRLKKTYYHQLPVSFSYFVLPHFSLGLGVAWNKFSSAVSEQQIKFTNNITQIDSIQSKTIFHSKKADSNFVKSYFQALFETQYQWKRWSFGARYSFGLEPYLRFQLPGGERREEKNSSLQVFTRYELWEPKKK